LDRRGRPHVAVADLPHGHPGQPRGWAGMCVRWNDGRPQPHLPAGRLSHGGVSRRSAKGPDSSGLQPTAAGWCSGSIYDARLSWRCWRCCCARTCARARNAKRDAHGDAGGCGNGAADGRGVDGSSREPWSAPSSAGTDTD
ncbi:unnamed protein product, partial [Laminaria digitata]